MRGEIGRLQTQKRIRETHHCIGYCTGHARKALEVGELVAACADKVVSTDFEVDLEHRVAAELVPSRKGC